MKTRKWRIVFEENSGEYSGSLVVTAKELSRDEESERAFWADGVHVEIDEEIISIDEITEA